MNRTKSTLMRWSDIIGYSVIAALLGIPLGKLINKFIYSFSESIIHSHTYCFALSIIISISIIYFIIRKCGLFHIRHFSYILSYPSLLVTIPISFGMVYAILYIDPLFTGTYLGIQIHKNYFIFITLAAWLLFFVIALFAIFQKYISSQNRFSRSAIRSLSDTADIFSMSDTSLYEWLSSESPIHHVSQDLFGAEKRASCIVKALLKDRQNRNGKQLRQTVVIQGEFGSGKSSIVKIVESKMQSLIEDKCIFVRVTCWGFSSAAVQEHILERIINELSYEVDCLGLRPVPSDYVEAISKTNSWIAAAFRFFSVSPEPVDHLKRLTPILEAICSRLVVIIEDTDRNGPDFDQKHIEAMLHNFRSVERVSFILTAGSKSQIDFPKIAEYILFLPSLPKDKVLSVIDRIRNNMMDSSTYIDPMLGGRILSHQRIQDLRSEANNQRLSFYMMGTGSSWPHALASLLNTPRKLKQTLSQIISSWDDLRGEVDLDELIMLTALRCCAPSVFTVFGNHFQELETIFRKRDEKYDIKGSNWKQEREDFVKKEWNRAVSESSYDPEVLGAIISELSPWGSSLTGVINYSRTKRCQSISSDRGNIYWERLVTSTLKDGELRDQEVLSYVTHAVNDEGIAALGLRAAKSPEFAMLVLFFKISSNHIISDSSLLKAASHALQYTFPFEWASLSNETSAYRYIVRWIHNIIQYGDNSFPIWLQEQMALCIPNRIRDLTILFKDTHDLLIEGASRDIRKWLIEQCQISFLSLTTNDFSSLFSNKDPYLLGNLIRIDRKSADWLFGRGKDWHWLAPLLLKSLEEFPQIMIPQVMMVFGDFGPDGMMPTFFNFNEDELAALFGKELNRAVKLLTQPLNITEDMEPWFKCAAPLGTKKAVEWNLRLENVDPKS